jgi:hypothetical protein
VKPAAFQSTLAGLFAAGFLFNLHAGTNSDTASMPAQSGHAAGKSGAHEPSNYDVEVKDLIAQYQTGSVRMQAERMALLASLSNHPGPVERAKWQKEIAPVLKASREAEAALTRQFHHDLDRLRKGQIQLTGHQLAAGQTQS